jgi:hypothetical protein
METRSVTLVRIQLVLQKETPVAQSEEASDLNPVQCGFESHRGYNYGCGGMVDPPDLESGV